MRTPSLFSSGDVGRHQQGPRKVDTHQIQQTLYNFLAIYFSVGNFAIFFFGDFFQVDQGRLTFERLDLRVSFRSTE